MPVVQLDSIKVPLLCFVDGHLLVESLALWSSEERGVVYKTSFNSILNFIEYNYA